ncbi:MAG: hypothetical protein Q8P41_18940 [Pseudomonadota bacterium]|nr:hypothetical protein [Pseudomonadota bacterium]
MRFAASPLLVAVAFGFLGPAALEPDDDDMEEMTSSDTESHAAPAAPVAPPTERSTSAREG